MKSCLKFSSLRSKATIESPYQVKQNTFPIVESKGITGKESKSLSVRSSKKITNRKKEKKKKERDRERSGDQAFNKPFD